VFGNSCDVPNTALSSPSQRRSWKGNLNGGVDVQGCQSVCSWTEASDAVAAAICERVLQGGDTWFPAFATNGLQDHDATGERVKYPGEKAKSPHRHQRTGAHSQNESAPLSMTAPGWGELFCSTVMTTLPFLCPVST
jgi:hypothetical protein